MFRLAISRHLKARLNIRALSTASEHKVVLDGKTLYIPEALAVALGWKPGHETDGTKLILHGWAPHFFSITQQGSEQELLSRRTVESSQNFQVQKVLEELKDR
ncbi:hypothetical protein DL96DRAFT_1519403 [Flagelloscypha sp. PMI_526]|nr:hypothetical protein DL96DRAFT_1519403 [Flagelloscypha sp. PMI_526]